eukprot:Em0003g815a
MNSPTPIPCHHLPSSSEAALSHVLKTEDFMTPYPYEQPFNHHLCFDPNFQQSDGLNVTGLMRIMPFQRSYQQPSYKAGPYHSNSTPMPLPFPYDPVTTPSMFQPLPPGTITFGQPHGGLHGDTLLMAHHCSPSIVSEPLSEDLSPHCAGSQTTSGADSRGVVGGVDQQYREDQCEGVASSVNPSPPVSLVEEEHGEVVRDIKRRRTGSLSSEQEEVIRHASISMPSTVSKPCGSMLSEQLPVSSDSPTLECTAMLAVDQNTFEVEEGWGPVNRVNVDVGRSVVGEGGDTSVRTKHEQDTQSYLGNSCQDGIFPSGFGEKFGCSGTSSLKWQAHIPNSWVTLCDETLQEIVVKRENTPSSAQLSPQMDFQVEADKGFIFSVGDDSYVCQKKNHFQISVNVVFHKVPKYVKLKDDIFHPIEMFVLVLHGVKFECVDSTIQLEQSLPDRSKVKFEPVVIEVPNDPEKPVRTTICRLHFSETTANNMRKRGRPNPDQKHFCVVVRLCARTAQGNHTVVSHISERIIVRASNPGHFDNDCDYMWLKSSTGSEAIYHHGKVGINTEKPEEALTVNGHIQLTGQLLQLSDMRLKRNITRADPAHMLENISKLRLYEYQLACEDPSSHANKGGHLEGRAQSGQLVGGAQDRRREIGVLAQELSVVIPDAVQQTESSMTLPDGVVVPGVLVVSKERVFMETVGAVQELAKSMYALERRIVELTAAQQKTKCTHCKHKGLVLTHSLGTNSQHASSYLFLCIAALLFAL